MIDEKIVDEAIEIHIEMLIDKDVLARIGADKQHHRDLGQRIMRIFEDYNRLLDLESAKAEQTLDEFQEQVGVWAEKTFPTYTKETVLIHFMREAKELKESQSIAEAADCMLCLLHFAHKSKESLLHHTTEKHLINHNRKSVV